jgi:hypothetical protein
MSRLFLLHRFQFIIHLPFIQRYIVWVTEKASLNKLWIIYSWNVWRCLYTETCSVWSYVINTNVLVICDTQTQSVLTVLVFVLVTILLVSFSDQNLWTLFHLLLRATCPAHLIRDLNLNYIKWRAQSNTYGSFLHILINWLHGVECF